MAKQFRLSLLTEKEREQLNSVLNRYGNVAGGILQYIEKGEEIPSGILSLDQKRDIEPIVSKLPKGRREVLEKYLGLQDIGKEPELSDEDLQSRLEAFQELGQVVPKDIDRIQNLRTQRKSELVQRIRDVWQSTPDIKDIDPASIREVPERIANQILVGDYRGLDDIRKNYLDKYKAGLTGENLQELSNRIRDFIGKEIGQRGAYYKLEDLPAEADFGQDVSRIQDILSARGLRKQREEELGQFETGLESELARGREEFLAGEQEFGRSIYEQELAPKIAENLNVRGLLYSGDLTSELTRSASGVQSGIESEFLKLQEEDDLFFQKAAYDTTFRKEIEAGRGISEQLASERGKAREQQQISFGRTQANLRRRYQEESYQRDLERQSRLQEQRLRTKKDYEEQQKKDKLISDIGGTAGQIGGTYIGTKLSSPTVSSKGVVSG